LSAPASREAAHVQLVSVPWIEINRGVESDDPSLSAANTTLGLEADFGQLETLLN
jgi:hypothetical protein